MSHHLDTPLAAQNGQLYIDDLYVFSGDDSTVFIMDVNSNITGVHVKPGFHHEARYEFKVHFDGARFRNSDVPGVLRRSGLGRTTGDEIARSHGPGGARGLRRPANSCCKAGPGETGQCGRRPAMGRAYRDPFYIDLSLLAKVNGAVKERDRSRPVGLAPGEREEQLCRHDGRIDRAGGLPPASPTAARRPHQRLVRHQTRHGRGRLAPDQPGRSPHDVADLLAR